MIETEAWDGDRHELEGEGDLSSSYKRHKV